MRTIFAIIAAFSALLCLAFLGLALATTGKAKDFDLGKDAEHTYALRFDGFDVVYDGRLAANELGSIGFETKTESIAGVTIDHQTRQPDPRHNLTTVAEGKRVTIPALYPIALFAILPLIWIVSKLGGKKKTRAVSEPEAANPA